MLRKKIRKLRDITRIKRKLFNQEKEENINISQLSPMAKVLVKTMVRNAPLEATSRRYSHEFKDVCLSLYYKSPAAYKHLQDHLLLPSTETLRRHTSRLRIKQGVLKDVMALLAEKMSKLSGVDRNCILSFDEMAITKNISYDNSLDQFIGFSGRNPNLVASSALVFLLKGLKESWKQIVGYFFTFNETADSLQQNIEEVLGELCTTGANVVAVVCDQATTNQKLYRDMGVTVSRPFFYHENRKIYAFHDSPHLLKSIRNNILTHDCYFEGGVATFSDLRQFVANDLQTEIR